MPARSLSAKVHVFEPSGRRVWTVVGPGSEHWVDPGARVCTCRAFRFGAGTECAHIAEARRGGHETVAFSDEEFAGFVGGLLADIWAQAAAK